MNAQVARYATLRFQPYPNRSEHLNYGIVVFLPEGGVRVHLASLVKLRVIASPADLDRLRELPETVTEMVGNASLPQALAVLNAMRVLHGVTEHELGAFSFATPAEYNQNIRLAIQSQCDVASHSRRPREPKSRLFLDVKQQFRALGILGDKGAMPDHQVIEHYTPDPDVDVKVEFALQNGVLRVAQTMDLRGADDAGIHAQSRAAAFSKAYAIHVTKTSLRGVRSYVIAAGAISEAAQKILSPIEKDAETILHWEDSRQMSDFFSEWASAAGTPLPSMPVH